MAITHYAKHVGGKTRRPGTVDRFEYLQSAVANAKRGQELPHAKLLDLDIIDIRSAHRQRINLLTFIRNNLSNEALAKKHGISVRNVEKIVSYQSWGHVA